MPMSTSPASSSGTQPPSVATPRRTPNGPRRPGWQRLLAGEKPLWPTLALATVPALLLVLGLGALDAGQRLYGSGLRLGSTLLLLGWPLLLALLGLGLRAVWRAARRHDLQHDTPWLRLLVPLLPALLLLWAVLQFAANVVPRVPELVQLAVWKDPLGSVQIETSADGRRMRLAGPLGRGDGARVEAALAAAPDLHLLVLSSEQGRLGEAQAMAAAVRSRGLATRASGVCAGACPLVFLAGRTRQLLPGASLGFHRVSAGPFNPPHQRWVNAALRRELAAAGLSAHAITKALATPPERRWVPERDELREAGLVSVPERPLEVELPGPASGPQPVDVADYQEALAMAPLWQALERRFRGAQELAAARMQAAAPGGHEAVQQAGQEVVLALMPLLLANASPETRWLYTEVLVAQLDHLRTVDAGACRGLLLGDPLAYRQLPKALAWREAEWLLGALAEPPRASATRPPTAVEQEVIRHTLGLRAPARLAALWRPRTQPPAGEPDCERSLAMLSELGKLAAPQRRLALRLIYERE